MEKKVVDQGSFIMSALQSKGTGIVKTTAAESATAMPNDASVHETKSLDAQSPVGALMEQKAALSPEITSDNEKSVLAAGELSGAFKVRVNSVCHAPNASLVA